MIVEGGTFGGGCGEIVFKGGQALEGVADIVWVFGCVLCGGF